MMEEGHGHGARRLEGGDEVKIAIVGARGLSTLAALRAIPGVEVTALCELDADLLAREAARWEIPETYRVYEDLLERPLDAVVIATPMQLHVQQAIQALRAGMHVLCEVTAGCSLDELFWLCREVERSGRVYMMAENYIYTPQMQQLIAMARDGVFGELYYGEGEYLHHIAESHLDYADGRPSWRRWWQLGRRGLFYPTHSLGPLMKCLPGERIDSVVAMGSGWHTQDEFRQEDTAVALIKLRSGKMLRLRVDCLSPRPHAMMNYSLQGTRGVYESSRQAGDGSGVLSILEEEGRVGDMRWQSLEDYRHYLPARYREPNAAAAAAGHGGGDYYLLEDFVAAVRGEAASAVDVYEACEWTAVGLLSALSVSNGSRALAMPDFRSPERSAQALTL